VIVSLTQYYTATTLDGFIADPDNSLVWIVGGGDLAGQFADVGLLDEVIVSIAPVTLGAGAPLLPRRIELRLDALGRNGDFISARFSVVRPPAGVRQT
jgi:RibD domain-containing protein